MGSEGASHAFGSGEPFTVGVEEELFLVDPVSGRQTNAAEAVQARIGAVPGRVERELHACQIELISEVCSTAGEAVEALGAMRAAVLATGAGLLASGAHPAAPEGSAEITDKDRYERIRYLLGDAVATPVAGLHVHVGMPDAETAVRVFNALRSYLPLLQALAANSPFRHGRDTGLASAREVTMRGWPRSGVPRALRDFADFERMAQTLAQAAGVPDYTWFWWKMRPHPRLGTVEVRALDAQTSLSDLRGLVALVQCLARRVADSDPLPEVPTEILEEAAFRAARFGVAARLPDARGEHRSVRELLYETLDLVADDAVELRCEPELERLSDLLEHGGGAGRQRARFEIAGMDSLLKACTAWTAAGATRG